MVFGENALLRNIVQVLIEIIGFGKSMIREKPYLIVADVARGDGKDNSAFHIFELETMEVVGEYVGKPTPDDFADILYNVARRIWKSYGCNRKQQYRLRST